MMKNKRKLLSIFMLLIILGTNTFVGYATTEEPKIITIAGNGTAGYGGDGGPATDASLNMPYNVVSDGNGNLYIPDQGNNRIRKVDTTTGIISTIAGDGTLEYGGDGGLATAAKLNTPGDVDVDKNGNIYIADSYNHRVRKIDAETGNITTIAGNGTAGYGGDGGLATAAQLDRPYGLAIDEKGGVYIADYVNNRIRKVDTTTGIISTIAGDGTPEYGGDGGLAVNAKINTPAGIDLDKDGNLYIAESGGHRIRKIDVETGIISTIAGDGTPEYGGDGGLATAATLNRPWGIKVDQNGDVYIACRSSHRIRKIDGTTGIINTIAGNGTGAYGGDEGPATAAMLKYPTGVDIDENGNIYIADKTNHRIRKIIEKIKPIVASVDVPVDENYITGTNLEFTVNFNEKMMIDINGGTPYIPITLKTGETAAKTVYAEYASGSGEKSLLFQYEVKSDDQDLDGISIGTDIIANGGTLKDYAGNDAILSLNGVGSTANILVNVNTAPTISDIQDQTIDENTTTQWLSFTVEDVTTSVYDLDVTATSNNQSLVPDDHIELDGSGGNRKLKVTPLIDQFGSAIITVTVTDHEYSTNETFTLNVVDKDYEKPYVVSTTPIGNQTDVAIDTNILLTFSEGIIAKDMRLLSIKDSNATVMQYTYTINNDQLTLDLNNDLQKGMTYTVKVNEGTVMDDVYNNNLQNEFSFTTIMPDNTGGDNIAPTISDIQDQTIDENTTTQWLSFTVEDVTTSVYDLDVTATSNNQSLVPDDHIELDGSGGNRKLKVTPLIDQFGSAIITVTVTDHEYSTNETFTLNVVDKDYEKPYVVSTTPVGNQTDVAIDTNILLTFSEGIIAKDMRLLSIKDSNATVMQYTYTINNDQLTLDLNNDLQKGMTYTVKVNEGTVMDDVSNNNLQKEFSFTTIMPDNTGGDNNTGGSSTSSSGASNPSSLKDVDGDVEVAKTKNDVSPTIDLSEDRDAKASVTLKTIKEMKEADKTIVVQNNGVKVEFKPDSIQAIQIKETLEKELNKELDYESVQVVLGAKEIVASEKEEILKKSNLGKSEGLFEVGGKIFDLTANIVKEKNGVKTEEKIEHFNQPVAVTIDLSDLNLKKKDIENLTGVRYEKDEEGNIRPIKLGGTYHEDLATGRKIFTFYTDQFSLYGVMKAEKITNIHLTIGKEESTVNNIKKINDVAPAIINNRTMVPVRFVAENLGAEVTWIEATKKIVIQLDGKALNLTIDKPLVGLDTPPTILKDRTFVPLRYVTENFGANVMWFAKEKAVHIVK
ncbi:NHL domain-containing protein [Marinisporobacter balticus]|uniref:Sugar lactone lactonase YvrE n=1 Tax=Marinisporobacter balticus TaxID=2018667 RepID=A0A4R2KX53_9FIRM|nr:stalk domain-containing protein [Marinisporobacter balticus]TCO77457.1 sugar lactone lactonase YvrE [Marinisporobacter balticus]